MASQQNENMAALVESQITTREYRELVEQKNKQISEAQRQIEHDTKQKAELNAVVLELRRKGQETESKLIAQIEDLTKKLIVQDQEQRIIQLMNSISQKDSYIESLELEKARFESSKQEMNNQFTRKIDGLNKDLERQKKEITELTCRRSELEKNLLDEQNNNKKMHDRLVQIEAEQIFQLQKQKDYYDEQIRNLENSFSLERTTLLHRIEVLQNNTQKHFFNSAVELEGRIRGLYREHVQYLKKIVEQQREHVIYLKSKLEITIKKTKEPESDENQEILKQLEKILDYDIEKFDDPDEILRELKEELRNSSEKIGELREEIQSTLEELQTSSSTIRGILDSKMNTITEFSTQQTLNIKNLSSQSTQFYEQLNYFLETAKKESQTQVEELKSQNLLQREERIALDKRLDAQTTLFQNIQSEVNKLNQMNSALQLENRTSIELNKQLQEATTQHLQTINELQKQLGQEKEKSGSLDLELVKMRHQNSTLKKENSDLQADVESSKKDILVKEEESRNLRSEITTLNEKIGSLNDLLEDKKNEISDIRKDFISNQEKILKLQEQNSELVAKNKELSGPIKRNTYLNQILLFVLGMSSLFIFLSIQSQQRESLPGTEWRAIKD